MAPSVTHRNPQLQEEWDLFRSIAEISNLTPIQLMQLLKAPQPKLRRSHSRVSKRVFTKTHRRSSKTTNSKPSAHPCHSDFEDIKHLDDVELPSSETMETMTLANHRSPPSYRHDAPWFLPQQYDINVMANLSADHDPAMPDLIPAPRSSSQEACSICPVSVEYVDSQDILVTSEVVLSSLEGCTEAPNVLADNLDYLHPDLAHCHVVTVCTEK